MAGFSTDEDRKIIPRWRPFRETLRLGELGSVVPFKAHQQVASDFLAPKIRGWLENRTVGHAADLVGAAFTLGREREGEVTRAARFLLQKDLNVSPWARELAEQALRTSDVPETELRPKELEKSTLHVQVRTFRDLLRTEPRDPITWVELSHAYALLGIEEQAERSMTIALQLAMNNRFIIRSASRLWIYLNDPERAHDLIIRADRTPHDPWLLAAEIAVGSAAKRKPRFVKIARRMLSESRFLNIHTSELASAVATLELNSSNIKRSKRLFDLSLRSPTENSIAQVAWASRQNRSINFGDEYLDIPNTFEARSWTFYQQSRWEQAIEECKLWQFDQPFSSRPSIHGSYMSAIALENYTMSEEFANRGLIANPSNFTLLNNLAFVYINRGNIDAAKKELSKVNRSKLSDRDQAVSQATQGLLAFRTGNVAAGRRLYSDARLKAKKIEDDRLFALASFFHAIEELSQKVPDGNPILSEAFRALRRVPDPIFRLLECRLTKLIAGSDKNT